MFGRIINSKSDDITYLSLSRRFVTRSTSFPGCTPLSIWPPYWKRSSRPWERGCYSIRMCKPKVSVNWEEATLYFLHPTEEQNSLPPRQRQFSVAMLKWPQTICHPSRPVGRQIHACLDSLGKIERYRIFNMFIIKIILFESVSVLFCVFHICFGTWSSGKIVRLFNLPTGKKI